jgi:large subunit ribosomal protein L3
MGGKRVTTRNIEVLDIMPDKNLILLKGSVPGPINSILEIVRH